MIRPAELREEDRPRLGAPAKAREPNPALQRLVKEYLKDAGLPAYEKTRKVAWDPEVCREVAEAFDSLPFEDESDPTLAAYEALAAEVRAQYDLASEEIEIEPYGDGDPVPYRDSADMMDDVRDNAHLWVYSGGADHAILSREENFMFRAVHDLFGHAAGGFTFGPWGEENAWVEHQKTFSPPARAALATETRGQNSWVNCLHADLPPKERPYADQKGALLPSEYWLHPAVEKAYGDEPGFLYGE